MKKVALVADVPFWMEATGQHARVHALYTFLAEQAQLTLYYFGKDLPPFPHVAIRKDAQFAAHLKKSPVDLIIVENIYFHWIADLPLGGTQIYVDAHDILSGRMKSFASHRSSHFSLPVEEEIVYFRKFDKVIFPWKEGIERMAPLVGKDHFLFCPHPVVPETTIRLRKEVKTISFFGGPSWPNVDSMLWFQEAVLPLLGDLAERCVANGTFVFAPFALFFPRLALGKTFSSLAAYYRTIDIAINPVLYGDGVKTKTVEAIAYGVPLVTTTIGAHGFLEERGKSFLLADTPEEFAAAIRELAGSFALRRELSKNARAYAEKHLTPSACFSALL